MLKEYFNYSMGEAVETVETVRASIIVSIIKFIHSLAYYISKISPSVCPSNFFLQHATS